MEEDVDLCCNSLHPQAQAPDDPLHDQGSQYVSRESLYRAPFCRRVERSPTNQHFHSLLLQFLSRGNEHLLSGKGRHTHLFESNNWLNPIFWGYVQRLLIQGYVPGWIRFVRQVLVCVHSDESLMPL